MRRAVGLVLFFACGGQPSAIVDASLDGVTVDSHDGAIDAPIDAPWTTGVIRITARNSAQPPLFGIHASPGTAVVFTDATQQTQVVMTDAQGVASATVTGPTTITHIQERNAIADEAMTIVGAMPGDDLLLERVNRDHGMKTPISVSFTPDPDTNYTACTACGCAYGTTSPLMAPVIGHCATDPAEVQLIAWTPAATTYVAGSTTYDPDSGGAITLAPTTTAQPYTGTFSNIPQNVSSLGFDFIGRDISRATVMYPVADETLQVTGYRGLDGRFEVYMFRSDTAFQATTQDVDENTTAFSVDAAATLIAWLGKPSFDPTTNTFRAPSLPGAVDADLFIGTFTFTRTNGRGVIWTLIAASPGDFVVPFIPTSVADMTPKPGGAGTVHSRAFSSDSVAGYDEARRDALRLWRQAWYGGGGRVHRSESDALGGTYFP